MEVLGLAVALLLGLGCNGKIIPQHSSLYTVYLFAVASAIFHIPSNQLEKTMTW